MTRRRRNPAPLAGGGRASEIVQTHQLGDSEDNHLPAPSQVCIPPGLDPVRHSKCLWCGAAFLPNRTGSRQRFCTSGCRNALWSAALSLNEVSTGFGPPLPIITRHWLGWRSIGEIIARIVQDLASRRGRVE